VKISLLSYGRFTRKLFSLVALSAVIAQPFHGHAAGVVTNASVTAFNNALAGGGLVTLAFNGTITFGASKTITTDTVIDGTGYSATLSGGNGTSLFTVNSGKTLTLRNVSLVHGRGNNLAGAVNNSGTLIAESCFFVSNSVVGINLNLVDMEPMLQVQATL
jgi:hypothetical protein